MPLGRGVHFLLQHALVDRADRVLRPAEHLGAHALGQLEAELGDRAADRTLDPLGAERRLAVPFALAPLFRPVGVPNSHPNNRDRRMDSAEGSDAGNPPAGADDHAAADLLPEDPVRRADIVGSLGRDRRRLQAESRLPERRGRLENDLVLRCSARLEREIEAWEIELEPGDLGREHAERLLEQVLPGLVPFQHDDSLRVHGGGDCRRV